jgi:hypothetical protein
MAFSWGPASSVRQSTNVHSTTPRWSRAKVKVDMGKLMTAAFATGAIALWEPMPKGFDALHDSFKADQPKPGLFVKAAQGQTLPPAPPAPEQNTPLPSSAPPLPQPPSQPWRYPLQGQPSWQDGSTDEVIQKCLNMPWQGIETETNCFLNLGEEMWAPFKPTPASPTPPPQR